MRSTDSRPTDDRSPEPREAKAPRRGRSSGAGRPLDVRDLPDLPDARSGASQRRAAGDSPKSAAPDQAGPVLSLRELLLPVVIVVSSVVLAAISPLACGLWMASILIVWMLPERPAGGRTREVPPAPEREPSRSSEAARTNGERSVRTRLGWGVDEAPSPVSPPPAARPRGAPVAQEERESFLVTLNDGRKEVPPCTNPSQLPTAALSELIPSDSKPVLVVEAAEAPVSPPQWDESADERLREVAAETDREDGPAERGDRHLAPPESCVQADPVLPSRRGGTRGLAVTIPDSWGSDHDVSRESLSETVACPDLSTFETPGEADSLEASAFARGPPD